MRRIHQLREPDRAPVRVVRGVGQHAVVAPAAIPRKGRDGHQLDGRDSEPGKRRKPPDRGRERALRREGADVELVDHQALELERRGLRPRPAEGGGVEHVGGAPEPVRLRPGAGIRQGRPAVEDEPVRLARQGRDP